MERINSVVVCRNDEISADDEVDFLLVGFVRVAERRKVEDGVEVVSMELHTRLHRRQEQFFRDEVGKAEFFHGAQHLVARGIFKVNPRQRAVRVSRKHTPHCTTQSTAFTLNYRLAV